MYRSSFRNIVPLSTGARDSLSSNQGSGKAFYINGFDSEVQKLREQPAAIAGESVVLCVVAKLMGLEAIPIPVHRYQRRRDHGLYAGVKKRQNLRSAG